MIKLAEALVRNRKLIPDAQKLSDAHRAHLDAAPTKNFGSIPRPWDSG